MCSAVAGEQRVESGQHDFQAVQKGEKQRHGCFPPQVKKQLRLLAGKHDTTIQNLLAEALNDLLA